MPTIILEKEYTYILISRKLVEMLIIIILNNDNNNNNNRKPQGRTQFHMEFFLRPLE